MIRANEVEYWALVGNVAQVKQAIALGHDVNLKGENGYTALHGAAENGTEDIRICLITEVDPLIEAVRKPA